MPFVVNAKALSVAGHSLADASLRFAFLACKNVLVEFASNGTSMNRIRENGCGFYCILHVSRLRSIVCAAIMTSYKAVRRHAVLMDITFGEKCCYASISAECTLFDMMRLT